MTSSRIRVSRRSATMAGNSISGSFPHSFHQSLTGKMELSPTGLRNQGGSASAYTSRCPGLIAWPAWGRVPHPAPLSAQDV